MIHAPIYRWPDHSPMYGFWHRNRVRMADWKAQVSRRLIRAGFFRPLMRGLAFPVDWIFEELPRIGFEQVEIDIIAVKSNGDPHAFILGRKGAGAATIRGQTARGSLSRGELGSARADKVSM